MVKEKLFAPIKGILHPLTWNVWFSVGRHVELSILNISIAKPISIMKMNRKIEYINECITFILIGDMALLSLSLIILY